MKILILDCYYDSFLHFFDRTRNCESKENYDEHKKSLCRERFGLSDSYSYWLGKNGCSGEEILTNYAALQLRWAQERGLRFVSLPEFSTKVAKRLFGVDWRFAIIREQVKRFRPDVLLIQERNILTDNFIAELKSYANLVVGQIASPIPNHRTFKAYDLILSSMPHLVDYFRVQGINSEFLNLGFESRIVGELDYSPEKGRRITFVGSISPLHRERVQILEYVAGQLDMDWYGSGVHYLPKGSQLRRCYRGEAWGLNMYRILNQSLVTINHHIDVASKWANNMRLFEATGVGACLVTDRKENLGQLFEIEKEILAYSTKEELIEKIQYLLDHDAERVKISKQGQIRTLRDHTYEKRISEFLSILRKKL